ncbi:hypothetical protein DYB35_000319 [Aphanomyces astaci]|uniref:Helicase ATP-binding domain-containing protein n=1 Tax=Aphanomyces astaci TaxID=112090 RepID=A0A3R7AZQ0_APHAT|nr:hypothetical protein DYB35_000319 [Aphanomyces astaci]
MTQQIRQGVLCKEWQRTPMQLLQEYCRSVKRQPAHYHNAHSDSEHTFRVRCVLSDAKSKDKDLIFCPTQSVDTTLDDAKHCAALLALLHLEPSRPHERKLPDPYREMWLVLQEEQKQPAFKPFKKSAAAAPDASSSSDGDAAHGKVVVLTSDRAFASKAEYTQSKRSRENRDRANIPVQVFMSQKARDLVESVLADVDNSLDPMGFQPMHIQAVVDRCPDLTDDTSVLDWLCLNVPEDELPKGFNPNGTQLEVVGYGVVAKAAKALETSAAYDPALHDAVIDQLTACGYSRGDCLRALELANAALPNAHILVVEHEIKLELSRQLRRALSVREPDSAGGRSVEELEEALDEELMVMESIYDDKCTKTVLSNLNDLASKLYGEPMMYELSSAVQGLVHQPKLAKPVELFREDPVATSAQQKAAKKAPNAKKSKTKPRQFNRTPHQGDPRAMNKQLYDKFQQKLGNDKYIQMLKTRAKLPAYQERETIVSLLETNQVVLISGATGCGKTTQVPQFLLDHFIPKQQTCNIICTQPRRSGRVFPLRVFNKCICIRLAAIGVATRVAHERTESIGESVGYSIRMETRRSPETRLLFCTTEIKSTIRELQQSKVASALVAYPLHGALPGHEQWRAGRVRPGVCYRLFSTKQFHKMAPQPTPEIHRVSLEPLCLQIQALELGPIDTFLANVPALSSKSPFVSAPDDRSKGDALKKQWSDQVPTSDHFLLWTVVKTFSALSKSLRRSYCKDNCLSYETLATIVDLRQQYLEHCQMLGFYDPSNAARFNQHSANPKVIKAALTAGLYGNVLQVVYPEQKYYESANGVLAAAHDAKAIRFFIRKLDKTTERVFIHPSSSQFESPWLVYNELVQTSKIFVRESTMVAPYALLLFGGELTVQHEKVQLFRWQPWTKCRYVQGLLHVDGWIKFHAVARIGVLVKALRHQLDHLLAVKVTDPSVDLSSSHLIDAICDLLITEGV